VGELLTKTPHGLFLVLNGVFWLDGCSWCDTPFPWSGCVFVLNQFLRLTNSSFREDKQLFVIPLDSVITKVNEKIALFAKSEGALSRQVFVGRHIFISRTTFGMIMASI
jgi:hypothetical protein